MRKIIFLSLLIIIVLSSSFAYSRPMKLGGGLSFRFYENYVQYSSEYFETHGAELCPTAGVDLFFIYPVLQDVDIQAGIESILPSKIKASDAPDVITASFYQVYLNGILNWGNIGAFTPFCGAGINLANVDEAFTYSTKRYAPGLGFQILVGSYYGFWRGELGFAWLNSVTDDPNITAYSNVPYFKFGYAFNL